MYQPLSFNVSITIIFILNSFTFSTCFLFYRIICLLPFSIINKQIFIERFLDVFWKLFIYKKWKYLLKHKIINIFHMPFISTFNHYLNYTKPLNCFVLENTVIFYLTILIRLDISNLEFLCCPSKCHCLFACSLYWQFVLYQSINQDYLTNKNNKRSCWRAKFSRYKKE